MATLNTSMKGIANTHTVYSIKNDVPHAHFSNTHDVVHNQQQHLPQVQQIQQLQQVQQVPNLQQQQQAINSVIRINPANINGGQLVYKTLQSGGQSVIVQEQPVIKMNDGCGQVISVKEVVDSSHVSQVLNMGQNFSTGMFINFWLLYQKHDQIFISS